MKLLRSAAVIGIAQRVFREAQKPENQRRIKEAVGKAKAKRGSRPPKPQ